MNNIAVVNGIQVSFASAQLVQPVTATYIAQVSTGYIQAVSFACLGTVQSVVTTIPVTIPVSTAVVVEEIQVQVTVIDGQVAVFYPSTASGVPAATAQNPVIPTTKPAVNSYSNSSSLNPTTVSGIVQGSSTNGNVLQGPIRSPTTFPSPSPVVPTLSSTTLATSSKGVSSAADTCEDNNDCPEGSLELVAPESVLLTRIVLSTIIARITFASKNRPLISSTFAT